MTPRRAVFLDRDGTINVEKEYLFRCEDLELIPGAPAAIKALKEAGFLVIVVTNQSGIGRGFYGEEALSLLHRHLDRELAAAGASVDAYYFCPHHPEDGIGSYRSFCTCRKPLPGMLQQAAADFNIDLPASYMIGDKVVDVQAGTVAGCRSLLVRTGYGAKEEHLLPTGTGCYDDLLAAAEAIIATLAPAERTDGVEDGST